MKESPILFSGAMVRAILDGRKTMTRRVVGVNRGPVYSMSSGDAGATWVMRDRSGTVLTPEAVAARCPYGAPGDRLWVRETFRLSAGASKEVHYPASLNDYERAEKGPWKPSIHMPRWASRITLDVTGVRVERLQAISAEDVAAEGVEIDQERVARMQALSGVAPLDNVRAAFACLWDSINGKRAPWSINPWVWVVEFRRVRP